MRNALIALAVALAIAATLVLLRARRPIGPRGGAAPPGALRCESSASCQGGDVCCIRVNGFSVSSSCVEPDDCERESEEEERERAKRDPGGEGMHAQLCDPAAGEGAGCPKGVACEAAGAAKWRLPPTFGTCGVAKDGPY